MCKRVLFVLCVLLLVAGHAIAAPITIIAPKTQACNIHNIAPDTNYNTWNLFIGWDSGGQIMDALLQFDISAIPAGMVITDAKFYYADYWNSSPPEQLPLYAEVHEATNAWNAATETWNSYKGKGNPGYDSAVLGLADFDTIGTWVMKDVSGLAGLVQNWLDTGTNNGIYLKLDTVNAGYWCQTTSTWPAGTYPYMEITYIPEPATIGLLSLGAIVLYRRRK
ncbi:MAG: DNRLRE domain-containing protein [Planctomycetota bacterium]